MWALHCGHIVDVAAALTSCFRLQSKHSTTLVRLLFHKELKRSLSEETGEAFLPDAWAVVADGDFRGLEGEKCAPHCRHRVVLAAAYSCCLKPQCGHSTLTLRGDDFATVSRLEL